MAPRVPSRTAIGNRWWNRYQARGHKPRGTSHGGRKQGAKAGGAGGVSRRWPSPIPPPIAPADPQHSSSIDVRCSSVIQNRRDNATRPQQERAGPNSPESGRPPGTANQPAAGHLSIFRSCIRLANVRYHMVSSENSSLAAKLWRPGRCRAPRTRLDCSSVIGVRPCLSPRLSRPQRVGILGLIRSHDAKD